MSRTCPMSLARREEFLRQGYGDALSKTFPDTMALNTCHIRHSIFLLPLKKFLLESILQFRRQIEQPIDDAKQLPHIFRSPAALVQSLDDLHLVPTTSLRVLPRVEGAVVVAIERMSFDAMLLFFSFSRAAFTDSRCTCPGQATFIGQSPGTLCRSRGPCPAPTTRAPGVLRSRHDPRRA